MTEKKKDVTDAELVTTDQPEAAISTVVTPMELLVQGKEGGASIEQMERLFDLQLRFDENEARKAYFKAVAEFKKVGIEIVKDATVDFTNKQGARTFYNHASLGAIVEKITSQLSRFGLSHSWSMEQADGKIKVTCRLAHELGHFETVTMEGPPDDTGGKNAIQKIQSTNSYLQRYTVMAITGLASKELTPDDDGKGTDTEPEIEVITEAQWADLDTMISQVGASKEDFCAYYKIDDIAKLPAMKFKNAMSGLEAKRKKEK